MLNASLLKLFGIKKMLIILLVISIFQSVFTVLQALFLATSITNLFNGEKLNSQLFPILLFVLFFVGKHLLIFYRDKMMVNFSIQSGANLRKQLNLKLFQLGP